MAVKRTRPPHLMSLLLIVIPGLVRYHRRVSPGRCCVSGSNALLPSTQAKRHQFHFLIKHISTH